MEPAAGSHSRFILLAQEFNACVYIFMNEKIERIKTSLQIEEDINLQIKGWIFQRIGWGLMLIFLMLAALGLFGNGILSKRTLAREGVTINYERFFRYDAETEIEIEVLNAQGNINIAMPASFTRSYKVETIIPEPTVQRINNDSTEYVFAAGGKSKITLFVVTRKRGSIQTTIRVNETGFPLKTFIYP